MKTGAGLIFCPATTRKVPQVLALQQLCLTQVLSLNQQKTQLAVKDSISFTFNKPRGITEETDKQQSQAE